MKGKPILLLTSMVKAVLNNSKTQTRRLNGLHEINKNPDEWTLDSFEMNHIIPDEYNRGLKPCVMKGLIATFIHAKYDIYIKCPYEIGMKLWVRETWQFIPEGDKEFRVCYAADGTFQDCKRPDGWNPFLYNYERWRPSIFMPKAAARIFLTVKDIKIERLQDITEEDAWNEGVRISKSIEWKDLIPGLRTMNRNLLFVNLWNHINAKRGFLYELNPWVWKIEFEVAK